MQPLERVDVDEIFRAACGALRGQERFESDHCDAVPVDVEEARMRDRLLERDSGDPVQDVSGVGRRTEMQDAVVRREVSSALTSNAASGAPNVPSAAYTRCALSADGRIKRSMSLVARAYPWNATA